VTCQGTISTQPLPDFSHDFVDLERMQKARFFLQLRTPFHQDLARVLLLVTTFIDHLLDGNFPFLKTHQLFLCDVGTGGHRNALFFLTEVALPTTVTGSSGP
jgi:hypothetical protein